MPTMSSSFRAVRFSNHPPLAQLSECSVVCCGVKLFLYFRLIDDYPIGSLDDVPGTDPLEVLELFLARLQFVLRRDESPFLFRKHVTSARHRRQQPGLRRCWVGSFRKLEIIIDGPRQTLEDIGYQHRPQRSYVLPPPARIAILIDVPGSGPCVFCRGSSSPVELSGGRSVGEFE